MAPINSIADFRAAMRAGPYAWPGGYPRYFVMGDGGACSFETAKSERRQFLEALAHSCRSDQWRPIACEVNWEDSELRCDHSGQRIPSAYGEEN